MLRPEIFHGDCHCVGYFPMPLPDPHQCGIPGCSHDGRGEN